MQPSRQSPAAHNMKCFPVQKEHIVNNLIDQNLPGNKKAVDKKQCSNPEQKSEPDDTSSGCCIFAPDVPRGKAQYMRKLAQHIQQPSLFLGITGKLMGIAKRKYVDLM